MHERSFQEEGGGCRIYFPPRQISRAVSVGRRRSQLAIYVAGQGETGQQRDWDEGINIGRHFTGELDIINNSSRFEEQKPEYFVHLLSISKAA